MCLDASIPAPVRRAKLGWIVTFGVMVLAMASVLKLQIAGVGSAFIEALFYLYLVVLVGACLFWDQAARRAFRRARAHDHLLCPACTYDLRTLDATGTCPECGRAYEHAAVRAQWADAHRRWKRT